MSRHEMEIDERELALVEWGVEVVVQRVARVFDPLLLGATESVEETRVIAIVDAIERDGKRTSRVFRFRCEDWPGPELEVTRRIRHQMRDYDVIDVDENDVWARVEGVAREKSEEVA